MKEIEIGGKTYKLAPISLQDYQEVAEEFRASQPDPVKQLLDTAAQLPEPMREEFLKKHLDAAFEEKKRIGALNDTKVQEYIGTAEGAGKILARTLRQYQPHLSVKEASELFWQGATEHGPDFLDGLVPKWLAGADGRVRGRKGVLPK